MLATLKAILRSQYDITWVGISLLVGILAGIFLSGCALAKFDPSNIDTVARPKQTQAVSVVWQYYEEYNDNPDWARWPPTVGWLHGIDVFTCPSGVDCIGYYSPPFHLAICSLPHENMPFSSTSFAHELCHAYFGDYNHVAQCMSDSMPPIETANKRLRSSGL